MQWLGLDGLLMRRSGWARKIDMDAKQRVRRTAQPIDPLRVLKCQLFRTELTLQPHIARDVVHEFLSQKLPLSLTLDEHV